MCAQRIHGFAYFGEVEIGVESRYTVGILGGGFKYFLGSPLFGEDSHFD